MVDSEEAFKPLSPGTGIGPPKYDDHHVSRSNRKHSSVDQSHTYQLVKMPKPAQPALVEKNVVGGGSGKYAAGTTNVKGGQQRIKKGARSIMDMTGSREM